MKFYYLDISLFIIIIKTNSMKTKDNVSDVLFAEEK
jgi:hypothetical protein